MEGGPPPPFKNLEATSEPREFLEFAPKVKSHYDPSSPEPGCNARKAKPQRRRTSPTTKNIGAAMSKLIRRIANYELSLMPDDYKQGCHFGVQQGEGAFADLETGVLPISPAVMQVLNVTLLGRPVAYAEVDGELQFWPTPDAEYHIRTYIPRETAPWGLRYSQ